MSRVPEVEPIIDDDNPEWSAEDFARSRPAVELPDHLVRAFPKTAEALEQERVEVTLTLRRDLLDHFRARSENWRAEIEDILRKAIAR